MRIIRVCGVAAAASVMACTGALMGPAQAAPVVVQDGLVNVAIGDVTLLEDVRVGVAATIVAQVCGVKVGPVAVLGTAVDTSGTSTTVCETDTGPVTIENN